MNRFSRIRHHVDIKDVKKRHLEETSAKKLEEKRLKEEVEQIKAEYEKKKSDWREELDLNESDWTPVTGSIANSTSQTFTYSQPNFQTGEPNTFTVSGLGGVESLPSSVKVDFGFGESDNVSPPTYDQLALAGYAKPILMKRRDTEDVNPRLDASQEFAQKVNADVMMNARVSSDPNIISRTNTARKVFIDYLTGKMRAGRWNEYLGKNYINYALKNATLNPDGSVTVGDNVIGGARNIEYDKASGTYKINFMGMGFQTNESEFAKNSEYNKFWKSVFNAMGKFSADAQPQFHVPIPILNGWIKLLNIGAGGIFGKVIEYYKGKGTANDVDAFIEFSPEELFRKNPKLAQDYIQQQFGRTGEVWSPRMMGTLKGSDPNVTHNYYALYGKLPPRSVVKGSVPYNFGDHPEYDPAVIAQIKSMRGSLKLKSVKTVKKMTKTKSIGFDRDEPIVRRKKRRLTKV